MSDIGTCVYISYDSFEAARIVAVLEDAGIPSYVNEDGAGNLVRLYSGHSSTAHRIFVPDKAESEAKEILKEMGLLEDAASEE
ncbi:MAG: DUF2007 domain-containing protein [Parasporobacterium sp.]|nr:DUF2007 domain-containing protein [Parasporobacterium sp.]